MQEKNYTNPEDRGRFGFSMSGEYRTPYKSETFLISLLIGVAVVAGLALFFTVKRIYDQSVIDQDSSSSFVALGSAVALIIFAVILVFVFGVGVRSVKKGFLCQYSANDETFTTTIGGDLHVIHYKEVTNINFQPRTSFGKIRGYDVTVRANGKDEHFSICSDGYLTPKATPFYIIQERLDIIRRASSSSPVQINTAKADTKAITRAEIDRAKTGSISAMDRMAQLLGETSNMPELSVDAAPSEKAVAEVDKMMNEYPSSEMPSIGGKVRNVQPSGTYTDIAGREHSANDTQAQGTFYIKADTRLTVALAIILSAAWFGIVLVGWGLIWFINAYFNKDVNFIISITLFLISEPFLLYHFVTRFRGPMHSYSADGRGFYITIKGKGNDQILYKDVLSVDYTPTKLLWGDRGYKVDILTTYGIVHYDYIFPRFNHNIPVKDMPFEVIRRNIPEKNKTKTQ